VFFHLSSRHCHFVQLNDSEFLKYCRMMTFIRIVFLFLTLLFPKRWISQKYRITQSKFTLSHFILVNDCTSGYFGDQTPNESKKPRFPSRIRFYHFWRTSLSQPLLDQSDQSARFYFTCYLRRSRRVSISLELLK
jgi:hypothetical protein